METTRRQFMQWLAASLGLTLAGGESAPALPSFSAPKEALMAAKGPDVGSLYPFIQSQAVKGEFPLSFLRDEFHDLNAWKKRARGRLLELLHYAPPKCDPRPEVVETRDRGDYLQEKIVFNTTPDIRVPAYVLIPKQAKRPLPAIVALHDHGGFYLWGKEKLVEDPEAHPALLEWQQTYYGGNAIAAVLARQGYLVIVIDMFYWGERRMLLDDDPADWRERPKTLSAARIQEFNSRASRSEELVGRTLYTAGFTWPGVMLWDDIRTVDYLRTRPEVDKNRIGCVGLSVGGFRTFHLAALDERIKAAVAVGWMCSTPAQLRNRTLNTIGYSMVVPGLFRSLDYPDVASLAMPRALMVINGSQDGLFDLDGVRACFDKLAACYKKAGVPDRVRVRLFDAPHEFNGAMQAEAWDWLRRHV